MSYEIKGFVLVAEGISEMDKRTWSSTTVMGVFPDLIQAQCAARDRARATHDKILCNTAEWKEYPGVDGEWNKWVTGTESGETMYTITETEGE